MINTRQQITSIVRQGGSVLGGGLLLLILTLAAFYIGRSRSERWTQHSREVARLARQAQTHALDRETAVRGFLLSRDSATLAPELAARRELPILLDSLTLLTADRRAQQARALAIREALRDWEAEFALPALTGGGGASDPLVGTERFDRVRSAFSTFIDAEESLYRARLSRDWLLGRLNLAAILLEILALGAIMVMLVTRRLAVQGREIIEQQEILEQQAVELEAQMQELEVSNHSLEHTIDELNAARLQAERALQERDASVALLDASLQTSPLGFAFLDRKLRYVRVNQRMAEILARPMEEIPGTSLQDYGAEETIAPIRTHIHNVFATGETVRGIEISGEEPGGSRRRRVWSLSYYPVRGQSGEITHVGAIVDDVTEHHELEEQLRQSQKMDAVGRLAGGIAHDFNNLLTVMRSASDLLLLDLKEEDPAYQEALEIQRAAERAAALTRQLLAFSRKQILNPRVLDANEVIQKLEGMLRRLLRENIELKMTLRPGIGAVYCDAGQLEQVLLNLAINASDAMPDGGRLAIETADVTLDEVYARAHSGVKAGSYVAIVVSDTGHGMDRDTLSKIFEPFFTTKEAGHGTGLGLATVHGIVSQSGGHIWVYSEPGFGTTFKVYLPRRPRAGIARESAADARNTSGSELILLVEDEDLVRASVRRLLERKGYRVLEARNGRHAIEVAEQHDGPIDIVVSDLMMPEMSGRELVYVLSRTRPNLPVLFMSGYTDDEVVRRGLLSEQHQFIQKPFSLDDLARAIRDVLDQPQNH